jgi:hypothetical protein
MSKKANCKRCQGVERSEVETEVETVGSLKRELFHARVERLVGVLGVGLGVTLRLRSILEEVEAGFNPQTVKRNPAFKHLADRVACLEQDMVKFQKATMQGKHFNLLEGHSISGGVILF